MRKKSLLGALAGAFLFGSVAQAAPHISVLGLDSDSQVKGGIQEASATAAALTDRLRAIAHAQSQYAYSSKPDVAVADVKLSFNCFDEGAGCMSQIAQSLDAQVIVWGTVLKRRDGSYTVTLDTLPAGGSPHSLKDSLPNKPTAADIGALATRDFSKLLGVAPSATLRVVASEAGASVSIDGSVAGETVSTNEPFTKEVPLGRHRVGVSKSGFQPFEQTVEVGAEGATVNATLAPSGTPAVATTTPAPQPQVAPTPPGAVLTAPAPEEEANPGHGWRVAAWSGVIGAVVLAGAGTVTGLKVLSSNNDKNGELTQIGQANRSFYNSTFMANGAPVSDACQAASHPVGSPGAAQPYVSQLQSTCSTGDTMALLTNVFIGAAVASAAVAGFGYYEGYVAHPDETEPSHEASRIHIQPIVGRGSGGLWAVFDF